MLKKLVGFLPGFLVMMFVMFVGIAGKMPDHIIFILIVIAGVAGLGFGIFQMMLRRADDESEAD